ncbi:ATP-binding protein [Kocuria rhizophila]|uniref:ATP-binding protein n=1 Tax=Kocuria rhizophila TaxID=72000 RepID=UPI0009EA0541|nr:ATP-binding protein [Kocuria rhizophila]
MDPVRNPYSPGAGLKPSALVGRDTVIDGWGVSLQRAERGKTDQPMVLYGLRGVGKTVLLSRLRRDADERDWITVQVEAGSGRPLREMVGEGLYEPLSDLAQPSAGKRLLRALKTALSFKASYDSAGNWNFGIDLSDATGGAADSGVLLTDLSKIIRDISRAAGDKGVGLALLIDETQDLNPEEIQTLAAVMQSAATEGLPVLFALAGLPSLPQTLAEAKSYSERFRYHVIEKLDIDAAKEAILKPARDEAVEWSRQALEHVVNASGRYPYFIQQFGQETWNVATNTPIQFTDAQIGVAAGQGQLDNGFFRARWDRTTAAEKQYLQAMCPEGDDGVGSGEVANRLNRAGNSLGPTRANLIHKGLIYAPDHGIVAFTVPGMASFIARQHN